jgi:hypothetical protein
VGLRGPNQAVTRPQPATDWPITPRAIEIYRQMRKLDQAEGPGSDEWWDLNRALNAELHLMAFPVYEDPSWEHDYRPQQSAVRRFHELERASRRAAKPKFQYKGLGDPLVPFLTNSVKPARAAVRS